MLQLSIFTKPHIAFLTVLIVFFAFVFTLTAFAAVTFEDQFSNSPLNASWSWENPGKTSKHTISGGSFNLSVGKNNDQWTTVNKAPRILKAQIAEPWTTETRIISNTGNANTHTGLVVYKDQNNWFLWGQLGNASLDATGIIGGQIKQAVAVTATKFSYLRIRRTGNKYMFDASADGSNWTNANYFEDTTGALNTAKVGILGKDWNVGGGISYVVKYDYFREHDQNILPGTSVITGIQSTVKIAKETGSDSINQTQSVDICGTDLGSMFDWNGKTYIAFGDTNGCPNVLRSQSSALAFTTSSSFSAGLIFDGWVTDSQGVAKELFPEDPGTVTAIPTHGIGIGNQAYLYYMQVTDWGTNGNWTCNLSSIASANATDAGSWTKHSAIQWGPGNFNQVAILKDPSSSTIYIWGIPCGRYGSVKLMKVDQAQILDKSSYRYFAGYDTASNPVWAASESNAVTVAGGPAGEISVRWNTHLNRYIMSYLDERKGALVMRESPAPWSVRSNSGVSNSASWVQRSGVLADAGRRHTFWVYFDAFPNVGTVAGFYQDAAGTSWNIRVDSNGVTYLYVSSVQVATGGTIALNAWTRITLSTTITDATHYQFRMFQNGIQVVDFNCNGCATATNTGGVDAIWGWDRAVGASKSVYFDDIYIDDGTDLADPGNIRVTAKLPNALGATNTFGTQVGTCTNRYDCVNERGVNTSNAWTSTGNQTENYAVESASQGDEDLSSFTVVGRLAWIFARRANGSAGTYNIHNNGSTAAVALTTANNYYFDAVLSSTYPSNSAGVGVEKTGGSTNATLYEAGMQIAYLVPSAPASSLTVVSQTCQAAGTVSVNFSWTPASGDTFDLQFHDWSATASSGPWTGTAVTVGQGSATITGITANTTIWWRVNTHSSTADEWLVSSVQSFTSRNCNASKVIVDATSSTLNVNECSGAGNPFTLTLTDQDDNPRNPQSSTVIQVTSDSSGETIYSDDTCATEVAGGNFTFTTAQNTKTFYLLDTQASSWTLTAQRTSGDTITSGTYGYTINATGGVNINSGLNINPGVTIQ